MVIGDVAAHHRGCGPGAVTSWSSVGFSAAATSRP